jgi:hypothetical protein
MQFKQDINDKRNSIRLDFKVPVEIYCAETDAHVEGEMINLSVHGMFVQLNIEDPGEVVGTRKKCLARIVFPGKGSSLMIDKLAATVVRIENNRVGLEFDEPLEWFLLFNVYKGKQLRD